MIVDNKVYDPQPTTVVTEYSQSWPGQIPGRLRKDAKIIEEIYAAGNIILFIDELHTLSAPGLPRSHDAANI